LPSRPSLGDEEGHAVARSARHSHQPAATPSSERPAQPAAERRFRRKSRRSTRSATLSAPRARACSHTRSTIHPRRRSALVARSSRSALPLIFSPHHAPFARGALKCFGQPCQKQPSTKMHSLARRNTISAVHLRAFSGLPCTRNLMPRPCNARRRARSGSVPLRRTRVMTFRTRSELASGALERRQVMIPVARSPHPEG
jgi:hypothetical protein